MRIPALRILLNLMCCIGLCGGIAQAQNSSLYQRPCDGSFPVGSNDRWYHNLVAAGGNPATSANSLQAASWTYKAGESREFLKIHDIVFIRVDELAQSTAQGNTSSRKNALYDARLQDWVSLEGSTSSQLRKTMVTLAS